MGLSRPTRARGLKHNVYGKHHQLVVAPHAGAWIETQKQLIDEQAKVAPHAGAWIETIRLRNRLKKSCVAPHAGAWIETYTDGQYY